MYIYVDSHEQKEDQIFISAIICESVTKFKEWLKTESIGLAKELDTEINLVDFVEWAENKGLTIRTEDELDVDRNHTTIERIVELEDYLTDENLGRYLFDFYKKHAKVIKAPSPHKIEWSSKMLITDMIWHLTVLQSIGVNHLEIAKNSVDFSKIMPSVKRMETLEECLKRKKYNKQQ